MDQSWLQKVAQALRMGGSPADPYRQYVMQAQQNGETPMSAQQFAMQQMQPRPPVQQQVAAPAPEVAPQPFRF
jgi:hypothetical protein